MVMFCQCEHTHPICRGSRKKEKIGRTENSAGLPVPIAVQNSDIKQIGKVTPFRDSLFSCSFTSPTFMQTERQTKSYSSVQFKLRQSKN